MIRTYGTLTHTVLVVLFALGAVFGSIVFSPLAHAASPQLEITSFSIPDGYAGELVNASVTVRNNSSESISSEFEVAINTNISSMDCSTSEDAQTTIAALNAGSSRTVTIPVSLRTSTKTYTATAMVDSDCAISESDEGDNTRTDSYTTASPPLQQLSCGGPFFGPFTLSWSGYFNGCTTLPFDFTKGAFSGSVTTTPVSGNIYSFTCPVRGTAQTNCNLILRDPECSDSEDNDGDGEVDANDPGCHTDGNSGNPGSYDPDDDNEFNSTQCSDSIDNDGDGAIDANDPGCHTDGDPGNPGSYDPNDDDEFNPPQCSDGIDNDSDSVSDTNDPGCHTDGDPGNPGSYDPTDDDETDPPLADLVSENLQHISGSLQNGQTIFFEADVRNAGALAAGAFDDDFTYQWNGTGGAWTQFGTDINHNSGLGIGANDTDSSAGFDLTQSGDLYIQHCVDSNLDVNEGSNETPNCTVIGPLSVVEPQCNDGVDNEPDGFVDEDDPGCHSDGDPGNPGSYDPTDDDETDPPLPNLVSENLQLVLPPEPLRNGQTAFFEADVRNAGTLDAGAFDDNFTYQWNGTGGAWTQFGAFINHLSLNIGNTETDSSEGFDLTQSGDLYIQHCVDARIPDDVIEGVNETPNCTVVSFPVIEPQCNDGVDNEPDGFIDEDDPGCHSDGDPGNPASYDPTDDDETNVLFPDLVSQNLQHTLGTLQDGQTVNFEAEVDNIGTLDAGAFSDDFTYQWNGTGGAWTQFGAFINHGGLTVAAAPLTDSSAGFDLTQSGDLYIQHCVDSNLNVDEGPNETPNCTVIGPLSVSAAPTAILRICNITENPSDCDPVTGSAWTIANIIIDPGADVRLRWTSSGASGCLGTNFSTGAGNPTSGDTDPTNEPVPGGTITYTVVCDGASDSIVVDVRGGTPTIDASSVFVPPGSDVDITWDVNGNDPTQCTITGPGGFSAQGDASQAQMITVEGESTYTITCPGGSDSVTIRILDDVFES